MNRNGECSFNPLHPQMMGEALKSAQEGLEQGELPIGAVLARGEEVMTRAFTCENSERRYLVHADFLALYAGDSLGLTIAERRELTLYVTLEPCMMYLGAAMSFFVGEVVYALESPGDGAVSRMVPHWTPDPHFPGYRMPKITGGVCRAKSRELFRRYSESAAEGDLGHGRCHWPNSNS